MTNEEIDKETFAAISDGCTHFRTIDRAIELAGIMPSDRMRVVDKSLQRLRRAGKVVFSTNNGWKVVGT